MVFGWVNAHYNIQLEPPEKGEGYDSYSELVFGSAEDPGIIDALIQQPWIGSAIKEFASNKNIPLTGKNYKENLLVIKNAIGDAKFSQWMKNTLSKASENIIDKTGNIAPKFSKMMMNYYVDANGDAILKDGKIQFVSSNIAPPKNAKIAKSTLSEFYDKTVKRWGKPGVVNMLRGLKSYGGNMIMYGLTDAGIRNLVNVTGGGETAQDLATEVFDITFTGKLTKDAITNLRNQIQVSKTGLADNFIDNISIKDLKIALGDEAVDKIKKNLGTNATNDVINAAIKKEFKEQINQQLASDFKDELTDEAKKKLKKKLEKEGVELISKKVGKKLALGAFSKLGVSLMGGPLPAAIGAAMTAKDLWDIYWLLYPEDRKKAKKETTYIPPAVTSEQAEQHNLRMDEDESEGENMIGKYRYESGGTRKVYY